MCTYTYMHVHCIHVPCTVVFSWECHDAESSNPKPHPLNEQLGLSTEAISMVQSSDCRVTVATVSGKLATFYDNLLRG